MSGADGRPSPRAGRPPIMVPEASIDIDRPIAEVFRFVTDPTNDPRWHTTVVRVTRTSVGPVGAGSTFEGIYDSHRRTLNSPARPADFQAIRGRMAEFVPNRRSRLLVEFVERPRGFGARVLGRTFELTFRFEESGGSTRVFRGAEVNPTGIVRLLVPFFLPLNAGRSRYLLRLLKAAVEAAVPTTNEAAGPSFQSPRPEDGT